MIIYSVCSNKQTNSDISINAHEIISVSLLEKNDLTAGAFSAILNLSKMFNLEISKEQVGYFLTGNSIWLDFLSRKEEHCLIIKDHLLDEKLLKRISDHRFPPDLDILFPFDNISRKTKTAAYESIEESEVERNGLSILLELLLFDSMYLLSRSGAAKLHELSELAINLKPTSVSMIASYCDIGWLNQYLSNILAEQRDKKLKALIFSSQSWTPENKTMAKDLLKDIYQISREEAIEIILHGGSLLGHVRHGGIMPWDDDIDLGIHENYLDRFLEKISQVEHLQFARIKEQWSGVDFYKIWNKEGLHIDGYSYTFPFVDIWLYKTQDYDILFHNGITFRNALKEPLRKINFEGSDFKIPSNCHECLSSMYTNWRHQIRVFPWSHRLERATNLPIEIDILTDSTGKMIEAL